MLLTNARLIIAFFFLAVSAYHLVTGYGQYRQNLAASTQPVVEPGYEFAGLAPFLAQDRRIGYVTDLDISPESPHTRRLLSAQYKLAPVILDVDNPHHRLILIDASESFLAFNLAEKLKAAPVYYNVYGKLLVGKQAP